MNNRNTFYELPKFFIKALFVFIIVLGIVRLVDMWLCLGITELVEDLNRSK